MSYNLERMSTVTLVDYAIADSESRIAELIFRKTVSDRQVLNSEDDSDDLSAKLQGLNFELQMAQAGAADGTDPVKQGYCVNRVSTLTQQVTKLERQVTATSTDRIQSKDIRGGENPVLVEYHTQYIAALQAKRAQLVAAAA